jgi:hypothetical protein
MRTTIHSDKLKGLFQAFRDRNDTAFMRMAEGIISEELAANNFGSATELQRALGKKKDTMGNSARVTELTTLPPKDRRNGEDLLWFVDIVTAPTVFFSGDTKDRISASA